MPKNGQSDYTFILLVDGDGVLCGPCHRSLCRGGVPGLLRRSSNAIANGGHSASFLSRSRLLTLTIPRAGTAGGPKRAIRVNCVAPGPIWTPLIPSTMPPEKVKEFGKQVPMQRPGQPKELAPVYVMLATDEVPHGWAIRSPAALRFRRVTN
jgi:hypothetical protein